MTITLEVVEDGTKVTVRQEDIPKPIPEEDADTGWGDSLSVHLSDLFDREVTEMFAMGVA